MGQYAPIMGAAMSAMSSFAQSRVQASQARAQAASLEAQGDMLRKQASLVQQRGEIEARAIDRRKLELRRAFQDLQGRNRANLGAGYVDLVSGSPLEVSTGNIQRFADDMGENAYAVALKRWETQQQVNAMNYQADMYDEQSSFMDRSANNLIGSLMGAGMSAFGTYAAMGGFKDTSTTVAGIGQYGSSGGGSTGVWPTTATKQRYSTIAPKFTARRI